MNHPSALETLKRELFKRQQEQAEYIDASGNVRPWYRYKYQMLMREIVELKEAINTWEKLMIPEVA